MSPSHGVRRLAVFVRHFCLLLQCVQSFLLIILYPPFLTSINFHLFLPFLHNLSTVSSSAVVSIPIPLVSHSIHILFTIVSKSALSSFITFRTYSILLSIPQSTCFTSTQQNTLHIVLHQSLSQVRALLLVKAFLRYNNNSCLYFNFTIPVCH